MMNKDKALRIRLTSKQLKAIDAMALKLGLDRSKVVRLALKELSERLYTEKEVKP